MRTLLFVSLLCILFFAVYGAKDTLYVPELMSDNFGSSEVDEEPALNDKMIEFINRAKHVKWTAGRNRRFEGKTLREIREKYLGAKLPENGAHEEQADDESAEVTEASDAETSLPVAFDWRRTTLGHCIHPIRDQYECGCCWAFGATEVLSDRFCLFSRGRINVVLSPEYLVSCDTSNMGCNGGYLNRAWEFMKETGVPTDACVPYISAYDSVRSCPTIRSCNNRAPFKRYKANQVYPVSSNVAQIQTEIMERGPVEAIFAVYHDFMTYRSGVYHHVSGSFVGYHAVKIIGWGVNNGTPYWIIANSWGTGWGMDGFFWMLRGQNECHIEEYIYTGTPLL
jgi:cathepsin B